MEARRILGRARTETGKTETKGPPLRVKMEAGPSGREARVYLYDSIGWLGIDAGDFVAGLEGLPSDVSTVHLHINSPGGDVFDARAIVSAIERHPARFVSHIDGLAASAATYVATAADEVEMARGGFMMVHHAWALTIGNAEDHLAAASVLEKVDGTIVDDYMRRTGKGRAEVAAWLDAETWFTAEEALAAGFVDRIAGDAEEGDTGTEGEAVAAEWSAGDLDAYRNVPAALRRDPGPAVEPEAEAEERDRRVRMLEVIGAR